MPPVTDAFPELSEKDDNMRLSIISGIAAAAIITGSAGFAETISTHILDLAQGVGGSDVPVVLAMKQQDGSWMDLATARTDENGRVRAFDGVEAEAATYRLSFDMSAYGEQQAEPFFPEIDVIFQINDPSQHYHVPVVVSPFGYSTYRGN